MRAVNKPRKLKILGITIYNIECSPQKNNAILNKHF